MTIGNELVLVDAKLTIMSNQLTAEQQRKIEENRRKALERRAQRLGQITSSNQQTSVAFSGSSLQAQPHKPSVNSVPAILSHHRETPGSASTPFFKQESPRICSAGNQISQSSTSVSSREVGFIFVMLSFEGK